MRRCPYWRSWWPSGTTPVIPSSARNLACFHGSRQDSSPPRRFRMTSPRTATEVAPGVQALVMIPTYNEAMNLRPLVEAVVAQPGGFGAVIVDDNSPDGTGDLADQLAAEHQGRVFPVHRLHERGRGTAGIAG